VRDILAVQRRLAIDQLLDLLGDQRLVLRVGELVGDQQRAQLRLELELLLHLRRRDEAGGDRVVDLGGRRSRREDPR
jgi:hypothetical protein